MRIGAHVDPADPLAEAAARDAEAVQFFLSDPQGWKAPKPRADADRLRAADVDLYVHAPYVINVATLNNRIRIPSRKLLLGHATAAAAIGAKGLIVHGGHVNAGDDLAVGFDNWRKTFAYAADSGGFAAPGPDREHRRRRQRLRPAPRRAGPAVGRRRRLRGGLLPGHLPRPRRRRGAAGPGRPGQGDHRPDRPDPRQQLQGRVRLRAGPARQPRRRHDRPGPGGGGDPGRRRAGRRGDPGRRRRARRADIAFLRERLGTGTPAA